MLVTDRGLVRVRHRPEALDPDELTRPWDDHRALADHGVGFLLRSLLDYVVDEQYAMTHGLEEAVDDLEDALCDEPAGTSRSSGDAGRDVQRRRSDLRENLTRARRSALLLRRSAQLTRRERMLRRADY